MAKPSAELIHILDEQIAALIEEGAYDKAKKTLVAAIKQAARQRKKSDDAASQADLAHALELQGDMLRDLEDYENSASSYDEALDVLNGSAAEAEARARIHASRAFCAEEMDDQATAVTHYQQGIALYEGLEPAADLDVVYLSNNLAFLLKAMGEVDEAETLYLNALNISHELLGGNHEQTAALCNNLGALYIHCGYYDRSREMNMMALDARREIFGEHHVETAQSHANVAVALSYTNDTEWAEKHFKKAIEIFRDKASTHLDDLEAVTGNYAGFLRQQERHAEADAVEGAFDETSRKVS